ncbi:MAG TPA: hypothetical protein VKM72_19640 [Thermoanaerobaculia bacterium]|nr:hypothetical protein [Thermoanaerobaculia bacterium]
MSRPRCAQAFLVLMLAAGFAGCMHPSGPGVQMTLQVQQEPDVRAETALAETRATLRKRLDELGVRDAAIETAGADRLSIRASGVDDLERLRRLIQSDALLELRLVRFPVQGPDLTSEDAVLSHFQGQLPSDLEILKQEMKGENGQVTGEAFFAVERKPVIAGRDIATAQPGMGQFGQPIVEFRLTPEAAAVFSEATGANIGSRLAIVLDGRVMSAPVINSRIGDAGIIEGGFTREQAQDLAILLRSGPLPARLTIIDEKVLEPGTR